MVTPRLGEIYTEILGFTVPSSLSVGATVNVKVQVKNASGVTGYAVCYIDGNPFDPSGFGYTVGSGSKYLGPGASAWVDVTLWANMPTWDFVLTARNYELTSQISRTITLTTLSATLSASPTSGSVPLAVTFTFGMSGGVTPYTWTLDYGNGTAPDSGTIAGTKAHTYTTVGTLTVTLTVTDALGATALGKAVTYAGVLPIPDIVSLISGLAPLIAVASVVAASELQRIHVFG